jgi:hypothetical protein
MLCLEQLCFKQLLHQLDYFLLDLLPWHSKLG